MKAFVAFLILVIAVMGLAMLYQAETPTRAVRADPTALPVEVGQGVYLPLSTIDAAVGEVPVRVIASPNLVASKTTLLDGRLEIALPMQFGPGLAALTVVEAQEHTLRQLMKSEGDVMLDTSNITVDDTILKDMAAAPLGRVEPPSQVFSTYLFSDLAKTAIQEQRILAQDALEKQADVAKSGYAANVAIATSGDITQLGIASCWPVALIAGIIGWVIVRGLLSRGSGKSGSETE